MTPLPRFPALLGLAGLVAAAPSPTHAVQGPADPGSELRISLVTIGPGPEVWERFGHNAIWVEDTLRGTSRWYNYGMFSFAQEDFVPRFIRGLMEYWMESRDPSRDLPAYIARDRSVWVQQLNLWPAQRDRLRAFLELNDTPANRFYRYDYYRDNCSTRIRDALDAALGGEIRRQTEHLDAGTTLRFHTQRLTTNTPLVYTGLLIGLGSWVDRPIAAWEEMFLPMSVREHLRNVTVVGSDGSAEPLVISERTLHESAATPPSTAPPRWMVYYFIVGAVIGAGLYWLGRKAEDSRVARVGFAGLGTLWALGVGLLGTVLLGLWVATDHVAAYWNENLFMFNPLMLLLAMVIPATVMGARWVQRPAAGLATAVGGLCIVGFLLQILPWLDQVNGQLYALVLVPNVVVAAKVYELARREIGGMRE